MPLYQELMWVEPLTWDDVFPDLETFKELVVKVGDDTSNLEMLYDILSNKYVNSKTRYMEVPPFVYAIRRELQVEWPAYLIQDALIKQIRDMEINEIMKSGSMLSNTVNTNDAPVVDADTVPISDLSTMQTNINNVGNRLKAVINKYSALNTNQLTKIYDKMDPLFRQILSEEIPPILYEQE